MLTDAGVTGILLDHQRAFGSGELKTQSNRLMLGEGVKKYLLINFPK